LDDAARFFAGFQAFFAAAFTGFLAIQSILKGFLNDGRYNRAAERASDPWFESPQPSENGVLQII